MNKKLIVVAMTAMLAASAVFAQGSSESSAKPAASTSTYTFGGSSTVAPIANSAIPVFESLNPGKKISYETLGSSVGIKQLLAGTLSLAGSSRELKQSELDAGCVPTTIALDGLSVAVNSSVAVSNLTMAQLAGIFSGEITNWKEVGGKDAKIQLIVRDETSGTYGSFKEIVIEAAGKEPTTDAIVAKENGEVATKIASTPNSIGYIGMAFGSIVTDAGGKILTVNGIAPNTQNVIDKKYPISRALYVVTMGKPVDGTVEKDFIDFLLSSKGQKIVAESDFIPLN
ncbi:MAG: phosphate ABC transporter substrate-binding protein [Spirochaetia bacterium]|jgi:phosphate transport system substrate-binding protein|nr:phosphate ABC transporter substrate-binding protein [Spirochaetia bacterium]